MTKSFATHLERRKAWLARSRSCTSNSRDGFAKVFRHRGDRLIFLGYGIATVLALDAGD